jgi:ribonuclease VapC
MVSHVLDTSALIAYLAAEPGADHVQAVRKTSAIPFVVLTELVYLTWQRHGDIIAKETFSQVRSWGLPILFPDEQVIVRAGELKAVHRFSMADSYIAACALLTDAILITADPDFERLAPHLKLLRLAPRHHH